MILKQMRIWSGGVAIVMGLTVAPQVKAQLTEQEFQMGRAREACRNQVEQQSLTLNSIISTMPLSNSSGQMTGSEVILNVSRSGSTYDVRCNYDNASRTATIANLPEESSGSSQSTTLPTQGTFLGRGLASGAVFVDEQEVEANLNFNGSNFSYTLAVPPGTGAQVSYSGTITRLRSTAASNAGTFVLQGRVQRFASSADDLQVINATGTCRIEVFDSRVVSTTCNTRARNSKTRFEGLQQF